MLQTVFQRLLIGTIALSLTPLVAAAEVSPNGSGRSPEPGWSLWQMSAVISEAGFDSGFSNMESGSFLEFQHGCAESLGTPVDTTPYWFRLSDSVERMGTGTVEYGCWKQDKFVGSMESTALSTKTPPFYCLRVRVPSGQDLRIRAEPGLGGKIVGVVRNGATVKTDSSPAIITLMDNRNWVSIKAPRQGWVADDRPGSIGNLVRCQ